VGHFLVLMARGLQGGDSEGEEGGRDTSLVLIFEILYPIACRVREGRKRPGGHPGFCWNIIHASPKKL